MKQVKTKNKKNESTTDERTVVAMLFVIVVIAGAMLLSNGCGTTGAKPSGVKSDTDSKQDSERRVPHFYYRDFR